MITVYAIISKVNAEIYVGIAKDADQRLREHNTGEEQVYKRIKTVGKFI